MSAARNADGVRVLSQAIADRAIPAQVFGIFDLRHGDLTALQILTSDQSEELDAQTVRRVLHVLREDTTLIDLAVVVALPTQELNHLPESRHFSDRPLVAVVDAVDVLQGSAYALGAIDAARALGWEIGVRHVGASYSSLAALAVVQPAVLVLDDDHVTDSTGPLGIETIQAVTAYVQSTGASVIAGRLDSTDRLRRATRVAATLGWGTAVRSPVLSSSDTYELDLFTPPLLTVPGGSCYALAASRFRPLHTTASVLSALGETIEQQAFSQGPSTIVCASLLHVDEITPAMWRRYDHLSRSAHTVIVLATDASRGPRSAVTTVDLDPLDPLAEEWVVLSLGPVSAVMLVAQRMKSTTRGLGRDFTYVLSYDREIVAHAARSLLSRTGASTSMAAASIRTAVD